MELCRNLYIFLKVSFRIIFVTLNNIYCIPTYIIWMILFYPLRWVKPKLYWYLEGVFYHALLRMVSHWSHTAGYSISEQGDDIRNCMDSRTLVVVNHQSTGDVPMLMACFNPKPIVLPNIMWIMDKIFKYTNFGIVSSIHQDFFILSGRHNRDQGIEELRCHLRNSYVPRKRKWVMLFPEGGFLRKRRASSLKYARKNNLPLLDYVTIPRLGALNAIFDELHPDDTTSVNETISSHDDADVNNASSETRILNPDPDETLSYVLDITIGYPEGKPLDLPTIIMGQRDACNTVFYYRVYPITEVPSNQEKLQKWLINRWVEKNSMLQEYYHTGKFPERKTSYSSSTIPPTKLAQSNISFFVTHGMFLISSIFHYKILQYVYHHYCKIYSQKSM